MNVIVLFFLLSLNLLSDETKPLFWNESNKEYQVKRYYKEDSIKDKSKEVGPQAGNYFKYIEKKKLKTNFKFLDDFSRKNN